MPWLDKYKDGGKTEAKRVEIPSWLNQYTNVNTNKADNVSVNHQAPQNRFLTKEETQKYEAEEFRKKQPVFKQAAPRQSAGSKTWEVLTNPMTAAKYAINKQELPDHFSQGERNPYDLAGDIVNPFAVAESVSQVPQNITDGNYGQAALNTLSAIPALSELKTAIPKAINRTAPEFSRYAADVVNDVNSGYSPRNAAVKNLRPATGDVTSLDLTNNYSSIGSYRKIQGVENRLQPGNAFVNASYSTDSYPLTLDYLLKNVDAKNAKIVNMGHDVPLNPMGFKNPSAVKMIPEQAQETHKRLSKAMQDYEVKLKSLPQYGGTHAEAAERIRLQSNITRIKQDIQHDVMPQIGTSEYNDFGNQYVNSMNTKLQQVNEKFNSNLGQSMVKAVKDAESIQLEGQHMIHVPQFSIRKTGATPMQNFNLMRERVGLGNKDIKNPFKKRKSLQPIEFNIPMQEQAGFILEDGGSISNQKSEQTSTESNHNSWLSKYK